MSTPNPVLEFIKPFTPDAVANGFATLAGALVGAMLAFLFQLWIHSFQEKKQSKLAAHRILFCLLQQTNTIMLIQKDHVYPRLNDPRRFLSIPATFPFSLEKDIFDFSTFSFMMESKEGRAIMYELYFAQESYLEALRAWNERSRLHRDEVQPRLAAGGIVSGGMHSNNDVRQLLGPFAFESIRAATDEVIPALRNAFKKLAASKLAFRTFVVRKFKTDDFTDFDFPETYGLTDQPASPPAGLGA
jgi:hypothetical protein